MQEVAPRLGDGRGEHARICEATPLRGTLTVPADEEILATHGVQKGGASAELTQVREHWRHRMIRVSPGVLPEDREAVEHRNRHHECRREHDSHERDLSDDRCTNCYHHEGERQRHIDPGGHSAVDHRQVWPQAGGDAAARSAVEVGHGGVHQAVSAVRVQPPARLRGECPDDPDGEGDDGHMRKAKSDENADVVRAVGPVLVGPHRHPPIPQAQGDIHHNVQGQDACEEATPRREQVRPPHRPPHETARHNFLAAGQLRR
mmetsp:Transcript_70958/g.205694  ORF Transcript_70958/g.205694 Transcript_70958/m.205694 type:complete len:261 (-) Transcript_70958:2081-2863(-)